MAEDGAAEEQLKRLERRLQRERAARLEAEAIAERGIRELYDQQKRAQLLEAVATSANVSQSVDQALGETLSQVCAFTGWPVGHIYLMANDDLGGVLRSARVWRVDEDVDCADFVAKSQEMMFAPGIGLPGRVLASGKAIWAPDVTRDDNFPRVAEARRCGLHSAFAFPILVASEVAAVMEFFCREIHEPDPVLLRTVEQIGAQLGRIIERSRADEQLNARNAELRELIKEAEWQRQAAEAASRAKSMFLAVTSHEVRTPLNAVLGLAGALRREPLTPGQEELAQGVLDAGSLLLRLLNAVLDLSKIESGRMSLEMAPFDPRHAARSILKVWEAKATEIGVRLELDLTGLPDPCMLVSDVAKIEQTLVNLLSNAIKFSPPDGCVTVGLAGQAAEGGLRVLVEVIDDGPGVAPADRERVFQPFEQGDAGRAAGGTGLGLSICAGHVGLLGGDIGTDRTADGRSRFWFDFTAGVTEDADAPAQAPAPDAMPSDRPLRILAAEDNAANRKVLRLVLDQFDVALTLVEDGAAAVAAARAQAFDLVLMDANMPVMDGVEAVRAIRAMGGAFAALPIHMLTANVFEDDIRRYLAAGADGVLSKPIDLRALLSVLNDVTEGLSRLEELRV